VFGADIVSGYESLVTGLSVIGRLVRLNVALLDKILRFHLLSPIVRTGFKPCRGCVDLKHPIRLRFIPKRSAAWYQIMVFLFYDTGMKPDAKFSATYLRFLNLAQAIRTMPTFPALDPVEERLLNALAAAWHSGRQVTVLEAMGMTLDVSPTTLHRRLKSLRSKGLLALQTDEVDSRVKYVVSTDKADQYFTAFGKCLSDAEHV
jgi:DNA-binding MarR family transcriptional regulator